jgi:uncharacterized protein YndB with AHSA1/START domain
MGTRLVVERQVPATPERAYAAWTSAEAIGGWWWPHIPDTVYQIDARAGGHYDIRSEAAGIGVQGQFIELEPQRSIRMIWRWMNDGVSEVEEDVRVMFTPANDGTHVEVQHLAAVAGSGEGIRQGWEAVLDRLSKSIVADR